jgi:hypothetical protein
MTESEEKTTDQTEAGGISEIDLLDEIERIVRMTKKAYGYQHLSTISSTLREQYPDFNPKHYGYKKLLGLIEPTLNASKSNGQHRLTRVGHISGCGFQQNRSVRKAMAALRKSLLTPGRSHA